MRIILYIIILISIISINLMWWSLCRVSTNCDREEEMRAATRNKREKEGNK